MTDTLTPAQTAVSGPAGPAQRAMALRVDPASYERHALHGPSTIWPEKNCYVDLWIELLHALDLDPHAMLAFTPAIDFEGDQFTFYKPPHAELRRLYGVDVQELTVWRPLHLHALEHLAAGRLISVEADAYWLPDTAGTDYRHKHTKTTIVLADIDMAARRLVYFHNAGCFSLDGEDFDRTFRLGLPADPTYMPLFAEFVRVDRRIARDGDTLRAQSSALLTEHLAWAPTHNPVSRFAERFAADLPSLREEGLDHYHAWAFATVRQLGSAFELAARHLAWLGAQAPAGAETAREQFDAIATSAKTLILKLARVVTSRKPVDAVALFDDMASAWQIGMDALRAPQR